VPPLVILCRDQLLISLSCYDVALFICDIDSLLKAADSVFAECYVELEVDIVGYFVE
jgi:hypothetical protein